MSRLLIIGAGGHGRVAADIAKKVGYDRIAFLDDRVMGADCGGYPVIGTASEYKKYDDDFFVAIGNSEVRKHFLTELDQNGKNIVSLIHPFSSIGENTEIGKGTVIVAGSVINPGAKIGAGCIINTCASVDHDCVIGNYSNVLVGAHICGTVSIGENVIIGAGATVINNVSVCDDVLIGAGAVVIKDVTAPGTYLGVPAKKKHENTDFCK